MTPEETKAALKLIESSGVGEIVDPGPPSQKRLYFYDKADGNYKRWTMGCDCPFVHPSTALAIREQQMREWIQAWCDERHCEWYVDFSEVCCIVVYDEGGNSMSNVMADTYHEALVETVPVLQAKG